MNQIYWVQTNGQGDVQQITQYSDQDHTGQNNWYEVIIDVNNLPAFKAHPNECYYDTGKHAVVYKSGFAGDSALTPNVGAGVIQGIENGINQNTIGLATLAASGISTDPNIYGIYWNRGSNPSCTRIDASVGKVAGINGARNDFDLCGPWRMMHPVFDKYGNRFIRVPKVYIRKTQTGQPDNGTVKYEVSLTPFPGCYLPACFVDFAHDGAELPYVDVGAYDGAIADNKLVSKTGLAPQVYMGIDTFRGYARNNGSTYQLLDVHIWDVLQMLFVIEFATLDAYNTGLYGCYKGNSHDNSGTTDAVASSSGTAVDGTFTYRGIENLYANVAQWCDGINFGQNNQHDIFVCDDASKYQSNTYEPTYRKADFEWCGGTTNNSGGDVKSMGYDPNIPELMLANVVGTPNGQYYNDYQSTWSGATSLCVGAPWYSGNDALFFAVPETPSTSWAGLGARLIKKASL